MVSRGLAFLSLSLPLCVTAVELERRGKVQLVQQQGMAVPGAAITVKLEVKGRDGTVQPFYFHERERSETVAQFLSDLQVRYPHRLDIKKLKDSAGVEIDETWTLDKLAGKQTSVTVLDATHYIGMVKVIAAGGRWFDTIQNVKGHQTVKDFLKYEVGDITELRKDDGGEPGDPIDPATILDTLEVQGAGGYQVTVFGASAEVNPINVEVSCDQTTGMSHYTRENVARDTTVYGLFLIVRDQGGFLKNAREKESLRLTLIKGEAEFVVAQAGESRTLGDGVPRGVAQDNLGTQTFDDAAGAKVTVLALENGAKALTLGDLAGDDNEIQFRAGANP